MHNSVRKNQASKQTKQNKRYILTGFLTLAPVTQDNLSEGEYVKYSSQLHKNNHSIFRYNKHILISVVYYSNQSNRTSKLYPPGIIWPSEFFITDDYA